MKINFTKKEYKLLVDMLCIADWVMHSQIEGKRDENAYEKLKGNIFSHFKAFEAEDIIVDDKQLGNFYETDDYFNGIKEQYLDEYGNEFLFDELTERLSQRDAIEELGEKQFSALNFNEKINVLMKHASKYDKEFEANGIMNLYINKDNS